MIAYLDSSALVKIVLDEVDSEVARHVWESRVPVATSRIAHAELACAVAAAVRLGRHPSGVVEDEIIDGAFLRRRADFVEASEELVGSAAAIGARYALRGMDAIHVASVLGLRAFDPLLVSWDHRQRRAAGAEGVDVYPETITAALR